MQFCNAVVVAVVVLMLLLLLWLRRKKNLEHLNEFCINKAALTKLEPFAVHLMTSLLFQLLTFHLRRNSEHCSSERRSWSSELRSLKLEPRNSKPEPRNSKPEPYNRNWVRYNPMLVPCIRRLYPKKMILKMNNFYFSVTFFT